MPATPPTLFAFQRLDVYRVAKELARSVHLAGLKDAELRDQATRASKSAFLCLCEGLPNRGVPLRRKYFVEAQNSLHETVGAIDLANAIGALQPDRAQAIQVLATRFAQLLTGLLR
jgi:four helix bundle protein